MADEERTFSPDTTEANRTRQQGNGVGQRELDQQRDPDREPALGDGTPANVDIHKLGQRDHPEEAWGEALEGATHGSNHGNRPDTTDDIRGQGKATRERSKEINTRGL